MVGCCLSDQLIWGGNVEFSHRSVPWAKSGVVVVDEHVSSATEAAEMAGLNFDVELWPLQAVPKKDTRYEHGPDPVAVEKRFAAVRLDTGEALSVVGSHYHPLNYGEAFDFLDEINPVFVAGGL